MRTLFLLVFAATLATLDTRDRWRVIRIAGQIAPEGQNAPGALNQIFGGWKWLSPE